MPQKLNRTPPEASSIWQYETKCRRCNTFHHWYFSQRTTVAWADFANSVQDFIGTPRQYDCDVCKRETVQDVVSYDAFPG